MPGLIPTEVVGSLPRPMSLQDAFKDYDAGKIDRNALIAEQDKAAKDSVQRMEETGERLVTDGEQRISSFATYPIIDTLGADVDYHELLPSTFQMNAGYFLIQCASKPDKSKVYKEIGQYIRKDAKGVKQVVFVGFVNPQSPKIETPEEVRDQILEAAKYILVDQLGATDNCGFSPFSIDVKPKHGSPDFAKDVASKKIANRVKGAELARAQLSK